MCYWLLKWTEGSFRAELWLLIIRLFPKVGIAWVLKWRIRYRVCMGCGDSPSKEKKRPSQCKRPGPSTTSLLLIHLDHRHHAWGMHSSDLGTAIKWSWVLVYCHHWSIMRVDCLPMQDYSVSRPLGIRWGSHLLLDAENISHYSSGPTDLHPQTPYGLSPQILRTDILPLL